MQATILTLASGHELLWPFAAAISDSWKLLSREADLAQAFTMASEPVACGWRIIANVVRDSLKALQIGMVTYEETHRHSAGDPQ